MLKLYRGDASKIKEFKLNKTSEWNLLGQGLYLTDSLKIANTYRVKGSCRKNNITLYNGKAANRTEALALGYECYCKEVWDQQNSYQNRWSNISEREKNKFKESNKRIYAELIEAKVIVANYTSSPIVQTTGYLRTVSSQRALIKQRQENHSNSLEVIWETNSVIGYITEFEFEEEKFNPFVLNVDTRCHDEFFWKLMHDAKIFSDAAAANESDFVFRNKGNTIFNKIDNEVCRHKKKLWTKIRNVIEPYGFIGYEYDGGTRLGGGFRHRAFCVWDEELVNDNKVKRFR